MDEKVVNIGDILANLLSSAKSVLQWNNDLKILPLGYMAVSIDGSVVALKIGDGLKKWSDLDYYGNGSGVGDLTEYYKKTEVNKLLDDKANTTHTHEVSNVTGLSDTISGKADTMHNHVINDITNLQNTLNTKANTSHTHEMSNVTGLSDAILSKADTIHNHAISDVTNLQSSLNALADSNTNTSLKIERIVQSKSLTQYLKLI